MKDLVHLSLVAGGGAAGAVCRHFVNLASLRLAGSAMPWGTLVVNVAGSLAMGLFIGWLARPGGGSSQELRLLVATGFLGGFTTFSAFSLDAVTLWERGAAMAATGYVAASVVLSIGALMAGLMISRSFA